MKHLAIFSILILQAALLRGQDLHLSNYRPAGMLFNPALTATSGAAIQVGLQYRKQWTAIAEGYRTMGAGAELRSGNLGLGLQLAQNDAGQASLKTTAVMLYAAFHKKLAHLSELSIGVSVGRLQKRFDPSAFTFDNQFLEGVGFIPSETSGESFARTGAAMTDAAIGLNWKGLLTQNGRVTGRLGFSLAHVHRPDEGFQGFTEELPMKTVAMAGVDVRVADQFDFSPHFFYQKQGTQSELLAGATIEGKLDAKTSVSFGMAYRLNDAVVGQVGVGHGNKKLFFSYDANGSALRSATGGNGAWELGIYLQFGRKAKKIAQDADEDGVLDHRDECPDVPGLAELFGCPEEEAEKPEKQRKDKKQTTENEAVAPAMADADGDGVMDDLDKCPLEPGLPCFYGCNDADRDGRYDHEDACPELFGPPDNDGCPVKGRDSDLDGIPDDEDYCLYLKGVREFHGCPDSDRDGISDVDDHCPYLRGAAAHNGCPANAADPFAPQQTAPIVVEFESAESTVRQAFWPTLDEFVGHLPVGKNYRVVVSGHTDAEGTAYYNYDLGQRRADQVMDYLVRRGIPYQFIETISYGENIPRRENGSDSGKARNRRCEVTLVE